MIQASVLLIQSLKVPYEYVWGKLVARFLSHTTTKEYNINCMTSYDLWKRQAMTLVYMNGSWRNFPFFLVLSLFLPSSLDVIMTYIHATTLATSSLRTIIS